MNRLSKLVSVLALWGVVATPASMLFAHSACVPGSKASGRSCHSVRVRQAASIWQVQAEGPVNAEPEKAIVAKTVKGSVIVLANDLGRLTPGDNILCIGFRDPLTGSAMDVRSVSIDFAQHVGRILESPIRAQLTQESVGRYCGHVNLGPQYYWPMSFHVQMRYVDAENRKRKLGLCLAAK